MCMCVHTHACGTVCVHLWCSVCAVCSHTSHVCNVVCNTYMRYVCGWVVWCVCCLYVVLFACGVCGTCVCARVCYIVCGTCVLCLGMCTHAVCACMRCTHVLCLYLWVHARSGLAHRRMELSHRHLLRMCLACTRCFTVRETSMTRPSPGLGRCKSSGDAHSSPPASESGITSLNKEDFWRCSALLKVPQLVSGGPRTQTRVF